MDSGVEESEQSGACLGVDGKPFSRHRRQLKAGLFESLHPIHGPKHDILRETSRRIQPVGDGR